MNKHLKKYYWFYVIIILLVICCIFLWFVAFKKSNNESLSTSTNLSMNENCYKYRDEVDSRWYQWAKIYYSKLYDSCLVETYSNEYSLYHREIFDFFTEKTIFSCWVDLKDDSIWDDLVYDEDSFDFEYLRWEDWRLRVHWMCDWILDDVYKKLF